MNAVDLFAGAGGFTEGAEQAGCEVVWAGNHWRAAVDTHAANHPSTIHACQDLHQQDWTRVPAHDLLLASPACQGHTPARGKERPHHDACRSTAWAVVSAIRIGEALEARKALPSDFMSLAPGSHHPDVWHDINRMLTLNGEQTKRGLENHICPLQFDIVDRLIERYSNPSELVFDPFGGLFTVPLRALLRHRRGRAVELSASYFADGVKHLQAAEIKMSMPDMFDALAIESETTNEAEAA